MAGKGQSVEASGASRESSVKKTEPPDTVKAEVVIRVIGLTILVRLVMLVTLVITITARLRIKIR
jgi:hypothetical protein